MSHNWHEQLPGFHPDQLLHDGCGECEQRASNPNAGIANLDTVNFVRAWRRAAAWNKPTYDEPMHISSAEVPLLSVLWAVQVQFERLGVPIGVLPSGVTA